MEHISVFIDVKPEAKARPRFAIRKGAGGKAFAGAYTPAETRNAEALIATLFRGWLNRNRPAWQGPLEGPLRVEASFYVERPKSVKERVYPVSRPDVDNYAKLLCDALNGVAWVDDSQICGLLVTKEYANEAQGQKVGIELDIYELLTPAENGQRKTTINKGRKP